MRLFALIVQLSVSVLFEITIRLGKLAGKRGTLMDESDSSDHRNLVLDKPKASRYSLEDLLN
jgi:hypothetical protein